MRTRFRPRFEVVLLRGAIFGAACFVAATAGAQAQGGEPPQQGEGAVPRGPGGAMVKQPEQQASPDQAAADKAAIVMPELIHFEPAPYPEEPKQAGIEGVVLLAIDIDATGAVTRAEVLEPAGHGFDEAAQQAALKFHFKPATRGGQPIAARIKYQYRFTLEPEAPPEKPPPPPVVGNLEGHVRIGKEDTPLADAHVEINEPGGPVVAMSTDAGGNFAREGLPSGRYSIRITAEGFEPVEVEEEIIAGQVTEVTYRLQPAIEPGEYQIVVRGERPPREVTRRSVERREISRIPGTSGDALRSIQSLPGVARPPGLAGLIIVRGSAPQDSEVFVDGSGVPLIYHFGGLSSAIPTELIDRIDFYPGNFSARYGRVMGGIVDVAMRSPNTECYADYGKPTGKDGCFHGLAQVDLIDTRALVQGPIGGGWTFAAGGRRSWVDTWLTPVLEQFGSSVTTAPVYYDYQLIANNRPTHDSEVSLRFFGSDDRLELIVTDPAAQDPGVLGGNFNLRTSFYRAQALYRADLSRSVDLSAMIAAGHDEVEFSLAQLRFTLKLVPIIARSEIGITVVRGFKVYLGQDLLVAPFEVFARGPAPPRPGEPDPGPFTTRRFMETHDKGTGYRPAWFVEGEITPTKRARIVPGARVDYARDSGHTDLSPRLNARYDVIGGAAEPADTRRLRTTLKGGVGLFNQPPQFVETDDVFGTPGLESNRAIHYSIGVEQELSRHIEVSLEGYYKDLYNLVSREAVGGRLVYSNQGSGYVIGAETLLKYNPDDRFFGWIAYTISRSVRKDGPGAEEHLFEYDQTHNFIAVGSYRLGRGWETGARFRVISGPLTTPVLAPPALPALYAADAASYAQLQGRPFSSRLPLFHQLDVRIEKNWQFRVWRLTAYLDVQNAYNNPAVEGVTYNYNYTNRVNQTGLPIIPSLGVRGEF